MKTSFMQKLRVLALIFLLPTAAQAQLQSRDLNGDGQVDAYYDSQQDISWLADANYAGTLGLGGGTDALGYSIPAGYARLSVERSWVQQFDVYGVTGWRLPQVFASTAPSLGGACPAGFICSGFVSLESELTRLYAQLGGDLSMFQNVQSRYWAGPYGTGPAGSTGSFAQVFNSASGTSFGTDEVDVPFASMMLAVWAVRSGDVATVAAVPEPSTYALMLAGLACVGWVSRRRAAAVATVR